MKLSTRSLALTILLFSLLLTPGCAGGSDPRDAQEEDILAAVQVYLREQRSMKPDEMGMKVTQLELNGDEAKATIQFTSPDGGSNLEVEYLLSRGEDGWTVTRSPRQGGHGGDMPPGGGLPPDHPPIPENPPQDTAADSTAESS